MSGSDGKPASMADGSVRANNEPQRSTTDVPGRSAPAEVRATAQELLRHGYIEERQKPTLYRYAVSRHSQVAAVLEPLDLDVRLDEYRGIAYLAVATMSDEQGKEADEWSHPLVRRQRMTLEQSLVVAMLRQAFLLHEQDVGVGAAYAKMAVEDLLTEFLTYFGDSRSDARNESRISSVLEQLKTYGVVSEVDNQKEFTIRPLIAHLANPRSLDQLLLALKQARGATSDEATASD